MSRIVVPTIKYNGSDVRDPCEESLQILKSLVAFEDINSSADFLFIEPPFNWNTVDMNGDR